MSVKDHRAQPGRVGYVVLRDDDVDKYVILRDCPLCGEEARVRVPAQGLWDWEHGKFVQNAFPDLTAEEREMVLTGTHQKCWDEAFSGEEE